MRGTRWISLMYAMICPLSFVSIEMKVVMWSLPAWPAPCPTVFTMSQLKADSLNTASGITR